MLRADTKGDGVGKRAKAPRVAESQNVVERMDALAGRAPSLSLIASGCEIPLPPAPLPPPPGPASSRGINHLGCLLEKQAVWFPT